MMRNHHRFFVDLSKDRGLVLDHLFPAAKQTDLEPRNLTGKGQLGSW
jgi:hypothetical protein